MISDLLPHVSSCFYINHLAYKLFHDRLLVLGPEWTRECPMRSQPPHSFLPPPHPTMRWLSHCHATQHLLPTWYLHQIPSKATKLYIIHTPSSLSATGLQGQDLGQVSSSRRSRLRARVSPSHHFIDIPWPFHPVVGLYTNFHFLTSDSWNGCRLSALMSLGWTWTPYTYICYFDLQWVHSYGPTGVA